MSRQKPIVAMVREVELTPEQFERAMEALRLFIHARVTHAFNTRVTHAFNSVPCGTADEEVSTGEDTPKMPSHPS